MFKRRHRQASLREEEVVLKDACANSLSLRREGEAVSSLSHSDLKIKNQSERPQCLLKVTELQSRSTDSGRSPRRALVTG